MNNLQKSEKCTECGKLVWVGAVGSRRLCLDCEIVFQKSYPGSPQVVGSPGAEVIRRTVNNLIVATDTAETRMENNNYSNEVQANMRNLFNVIFHECGVLGALFPAVNVLADHRQAGQNTIENFSFQLNDRVMAQHVPMITSGRHGTINSIHSSNEDYDELTYTILWDGERYSTDRTPFIADELVFVSRSDKEYSR